MGFSLLRWGKSGRDWSRGEPPPRGSVEYCGVPEAFQPPPRTPPSSSSGNIWEITASEIDAANRWVDTLARSADYARRVHGDQILSARDASDLADFVKRWRKFASRVGTWSLLERARESNKNVFEALLAESRRLHDRFSAKGMTLVPVPHVTELVLTLRSLPPRLTPREGASRLLQVANWGQSMLDSSRTTGEWVQRTGMQAAGAALLGPAGLLFANRMPTSWSGDRRGLERAVREAADAARHLTSASDASTSYGREDPVYREIVKRMTTVYAEAAGLFGIGEVRTSAVAEAVDAGARQVDRGASGLAWLLGAAGALYLGSRWIESRGERRRGEEDDVKNIIVAEPGDIVVANEDDEDDGEDGEEHGSGDDYEGDEHGA